MSAPENPPAFPRTGEGFGNPRYDTPGMTLRDWFAGQALLGMLSAHKIGAISSTDAAYHAFGFADAMLAARPPGDAP